MNPARWARIEEVCWAALERPPGERAAFVGQECGEDEELRAAVEGLLAELERSPEFLEAPLVRVPDMAGEPPPDPESGATSDAAGARRIGGDRVVRLLGRGGMGEVYLAMRGGTDFEVPVAIKVIKRGMDTEDVLRRFRQERRILAGLRHPNIAQLLDGGATEDGRPYFVMEYVDGTPLTEHCRREGLDDRARLRLFQAICGAVQHAHQKLVVHRDLKPSNILVTSEGAPKLLDFGIGKVLSADGDGGDTPATRTGVRVLTPAYAAPEQLRGEAPTTATDVYGLGMLLFELLTGQRPFAADGISDVELERRVLQDEPPRPSAAAGRRALAGDLDNIVLKALAKEPERRYTSAAALAEDVQRHLDGRPVRARPPTFAYRAGRFLRRNAAAVALSGVVAASLVVVTGLSVVQSRRLAEERDKAREVSGFLLETFGATGPDRAAADTVTARQLLDRQAEVLPTTYSDRPELRAEMMHTVAEGYERLNLLEEAERWAREALALRRQVLGPDHPDVAHTLNLLGWVRYVAGDRAEARGLLEESIATYRAAGRAEHARLSRALNDLGVLLDSEDEHELARPLLEEALAFRREVYGPFHRSTGITANNLAANHYYRGRYDDATRAGQEAVTALTASLGPDHQRTILAQGNFTVFLDFVGGLDGELDVYRELAERQRRLAGPDHPVLAHILHNLGGVLLIEGRDAEAEAELREALRVREVSLGAEHPEYAATLSRLGGAVLRVHGPEQALPLQERALRIQRTSLGDAHRDMVETYDRIADVHRALGDTAAWEAAQREAVRVAERALGPEHPQVGAPLSWLTETLMEIGKSTEARAIAERALEIVSASLAPGHPNVHGARLLLAQASLAVGDAATADSLLTLVQAGVDAGEGDERTRTWLEELRSER